jgi:hypothetical protein
MLHADDQHSILLFKNLKLTPKQQYDLTHVSALCMTVQLASTGPHLMAGFRPRNNVLWPRQQQDWEYKVFHPPP